MSLDVYLIKTMPTEVFSSNITHNLSGMANKAGIYNALWRPDETGIKTAGQLIPILETGLSKLKKSPAKYKKFNPSNGWGDYEGLVKFVKDYLSACKEHPTAKIEVSR